MANEGEQDRDEAPDATESDNGFDEAYDGAFADSGDGESEDTDDEADGEATAAASDAPEEKATPPTAEELGLDPKNPAEKAIFDKALRTWTKWASRHDAKHKAEAKQPEQAKQEQPAQQADGEAWDPYTVPLDSFVYDGGKEAEDSVLAGAEADIDRRIQKGVAAGIKFALDAMRGNDQRLREEAQTGSAREVIGKYAVELQAHPDWPEKQAELAEFASSTGELAKKNPEAWVRAAEALTGISRGWRGEAGKQTAERGKEHQRIAKKPLANMARTTSAGRTGLGNIANRTNMTTDEAAEANYARIFGHGR